MSRLRTPIARARGLGSAKDGTAHFWLQRMTAVALVPLLLWFTASLVGLSGAGYVDFITWIAIPFNAVALLLLLIALFWHSSLGVQVVVEDYIHPEGAKLTLLVLSRLVHSVLALAAIYAVLRIGLGSQ